jgi:hypothetical protein
LHGLARQWSRRGDICGRDRLRSRALTTSTEARTQIVGSIFRSHIDQPFAESRRGQNRGFQLNAQAVPNTAAATRHSVCSTLRILLILQPIELRHCGQGHPAAQALP